MDANMAHEVEMHKSSDIGHKRKRGTFYLCSVQVFPATSKLRN